MIPAAFAYKRPKTLDEAVGLIAGDGAEVKVLAGGQSILPLLKLRLASVDQLVDIGRLEELRGVRRTDDGGFSIGAATTYTELLDSPVVELACMADALPTIADVQVRNRGTIGGSIAHADPASDLPAVLLALEATVVARSQKGDRSIPITSFFSGPFQTALAANEIITEIRLPAPSQGYGSAYVNIEQPASGYAIAGVAAVLGHSGGVMGSTIIEDVRVGVTGVADHAYRATAVENALRGTDCSRDRIARASEQAAQGVEVNSDIHADRDYRTAMAQVLARRAIEAARARSA
jgi:carbon-monoxide dehydrogenase medium subunit